MLRVQRKKALIVGGVTMFMITCGVIVQFKDEIRLSFVNRLLFVRKVSIHFMNNSPYVSRLEIERVISPALGKNILEVDTNVLLKKIQKNNWIKKASIEKVFPNQLLVSLLTYEPIAIVLLDRLFYIDKNFAIFKHVTKTDDHDLIYITGLKDEKDLDNLTLKECVNFLDEHKLGVAELYFDIKEGITLYMMDRKGKVFLGIDDYTKKLEHLAHITRDLQKKDIEFHYINLSSLTRGIVKKIELEEGI